MEQNIDHNKIIKDAAGSVLSSAGLFQKGKSRMWIDDQRWFLILVEFQPSGWDQGSYLNVGINYLWSRQDYLSFDYGNRQHDFMAYKGNPEKFYEDMVILAKKAMEKVEDYRKFSKLSYAKEQICKGRKLKEDTHEFYQKMMICGLTKDEQAEKYYKELLKKLENVQFRWEEAYKKELLEQIAPVIGSKTLFYEYISGKIRSQREFWHNTKTGMKKIKVDGFPVIKFP